MAIIPLLEIMDRGKLLSSRYLLTRLRPFLAPYFGRYALAMSLLLVTSLIGVLPPVVLKSLIDRGIVVGNFRQIGICAAELFLLAVVGSITRWLMEYTHEWVSSHFINDLQGSLFAHILRQPMAFFLRTTEGEILSRLRTDTTALYGVFANLFLGAVSEAVQILCILGILFYLDTKLSAIMSVLIFPVVFIVLHSRKPLHRQSLRSRDANVEVTEFFRERIGNMSLIRLYNGKAQEKRRHKGLAETVIKETLRAVRLRFTSTFLIGLCVASSSVAVLLVGGWEVVRHRITVGALFAFYVYCGRLFTPVQSFSSRSFDIHTGIASAQRIVELLDVKPDIADPLHPIPIPVDTHSIDLAEVEFSYPNADRPALQEVSLTIAPGARIALVGASGAGKSTFVALLTRLYDVQRGSIRIDGVDLRDIALDNLYELFGVYTQEAHLLDSSIRENICYGRPTASQEEVERAARKANLHDFILSLPAGYETRVGPRGVMLSGGQRQRLALARLLLKDSPIWILDEFTSALDSHSEAIVSDNLEPLLEGRTVIYIAHRLSTILGVDQVVVLDQGRIVAVDTHDRLYHHNRFYKELFDRQYIATPLSV